jgi:hypothetical protein
VGRTLDERIKKRLERLIGLEFSIDDIPNIRDKLYDALWDVCRDLNLEVTLEDTGEGDLLMVDINCSTKHYIAMLGLNYVVADITVEKEDN